MTQPILAFRTEALKEVYPELEVEGNHYLPLRLDELNSISFIMERSEIEKNPDYIHPIPYVLVRNTQGEFFTYQRCKGIGEERLLGNYSIGFGGHMDEVAVVYDEDGLIDLGLSLSSCTLRELFEELDVDQADIVKAYYQSMARGELDFGVIYMPGDEVGRQHLGIVMVVTLDDAWTLETELVGIGYHSADVLQSTSMNFGDRLEPWSRYVLDLLAQESWIEEFEDDIIS